MQNKPASQNQTYALWGATAFAGALLAFSTASVDGALGTIGVTAGILLILGGLGGLVWQWAKANDLIPQAAPPKQPGDRRRG